MCSEKGLAGVCEPAAGAGNSLGSDVLYKKHLLVGVWNTSGQVASEFQYSHFYEQRKQIPY